MTTSEAIKTLRHRGCLNMFDFKERLFVKIQLNKEGKDFICWQLFVAKSKGHWTNWNQYLSLKDVMKIRQKIIRGNTEVRKCR